MHSILQRTSSSRRMSSGHKLIKNSTPQVDRENSSVEEIGTPPPPFTEGYGPVNSYWGLHHRGHQDLRVCNSWSSCHGGILGKSKALWGKPRTLLRLSQRPTELSCTKFDEERSKKSKAIDEQRCGTVFCVNTSAYARVRLSYEFRL